MLPETDRSPSSDSLRQTPCLRFLGFWETPSMALIFCMILETDRPPSSESARCMPCLRFLAFWETDLPPPPSKSDQPPSFFESLWSSFPQPPSFLPPYFQPIHQLPRPESQKYEQHKTTAYLIDLFFTSGRSARCSPIEEDCPKLLPSLTSSTMICPPGTTSAEETAENFSFNQFELLCRTSLSRESFSFVSFFR